MWKAYVRKYTKLAACRGRGADQRERIVGRWPCDGESVDLRTYTHSVNRVGADGVRTDVFRDFGNDEAAVIAFRNTACRNSN